MSDLLFIPEMGMAFIAAIKKQGSFTFTVVLDFDSDHVCTIVLEKVHC